MTPIERAARLEEICRRRGTEDFGQWGSANDHHRYFEPVHSRSRQRCHCGCMKRATHRGMANGVCLTTGCEFSMARWARDGFGKPCS